MNIKIKTPATRIYYPDIEDNLELPEEERFAIELKRPPRHELYLKSVRISDDDSVDTDISAYSLAHVRRLVNPPTLTVDGEDRPMVPNDIFKFDEFTAIASKVLNLANEMDPSAGSDSKN